MADFVTIEVINGLQRLYALRLSGAPASDTLEYTAQVWIEALKSLPMEWSEFDQGRITRGFNYLIPRVEKWPAPKHLIDVLPARPVEPIKLDHKLSAEQLMKNRARIRALSNIFKPMNGVKK